MQNDDANQSFWSDVCFNGPLRDTKDYAINGSMKILALPESLRDFGAITAKILLGGSQSPGTWSMTVMTRFMEVSPLTGHTCEVR